MKNLAALAACTVLCACGADLEMQSIAHRGMWSAALPQNTVESIRLAYASGATWVETDFWHVKSGLFVCMHADAELKSQSGCAKKVADLTAADLATLNLGAGAKLDKVYRIPVLDQILALVPRTGVLQAEIKGYTPQYADIFDKAVKAAGLTEKNIVVSSFNYDALRDFKKRYPAYRAVWLCAFKAPQDKPFDIKSYIVQAKAAHIEVLCPGCGSTIKTMTPADADAVRAAGLEFRMYGVNSLTDMQQAKKLGAAGFTTNHYKDAFDWARQVGGVTLKP